MKSRYPVRLRTIGGFPLVLCSRSDIVPSSGFFCVGNLIAVAHRNFLADETLGAEIAGWWIGDESIRAPVEQIARRDGRGGNSRELTGRERSLKLLEIGP